jgi:ABC-type Fe3+-hydroxamate transport system substrate-binding protein
MQHRLFKDQLNRTVSIPNPPLRIISLVPSQTELLFDLGLDEEIVGITRFCIHPAGRCKVKTKVGGTKKLNLDLIRSLKPDLIIGNKEENDQRQIEALMQDFPVWMSDIANLEEALTMMEGVGAITGKAVKAGEMTSLIRERFRKLADLNHDHPQRIAYMIWKDPMMAAGGDTFINDVLERAGWINAVEKSRYPELSSSELKAYSPDLIFLSSEPYPFKERHLAEFREICPDAQVRIVDGEMFSWYGSRLLRVPSYLQTLSAQKS